MCPTYGWKCAQCEVQIDVLCKIAERDNVPTETCMCEQPQWQRVVEMPGIVGKASFLDGQRRFSEMREAAQINKEARLSKSNEKKKEIAAEIRKMGVTLGKKEPI